MAWIIAHDAVMFIDRKIHMDELSLARRSDSLRFTLRQRGKY